MRIVCKKKFSTLLQQIKYKTQKKYLEVRYFKFHVVSTIIGRKREKKEPISRNYK